MIWGDNLDLNKEEEKLIRQYRKESQSKNKPKKKKKIKIQYTKLILNMVIFLTIITTIASIYINLKNGMALDSVVASCWDGLKFIVPSYCCKAFFESKEEKKARLDYLAKGMDYEEHEQQ